MTEQEAITAFTEYIKICIDAEGVWPSQMVAYKDDDKVDMFALMVDSPQAMLAYVAESRKPDTQYLILGIDRFTKPGQGNEPFKDTVGCHIYIREGRQYKFGVIDYQHEPRIVRDMNLDNAHWNQALARELRQFIPVGAK